jgi:hypothetical protein
MIRYAGLVEAQLDNQSMADEFGRATVMLARKSGMRISSYSHCAMLR